MQRSAKRDRSWDLIQHPGPHTPAPLRKASASRLHDAAHALLEPKELATDCSTPRVRLENAPNRMTLMRSLAFLTLIADTRVTRAAKEAQERMENPTRAHSH